MTILWSLQSCLPKSRSWTDQFLKALPAELNSKCVNWQEERGAWTPGFMRSGQLASGGGWEREEWRGVCTEGCPQELEDRMLPPMA